MRIVIISTSDITGGASKAAYNLLRGLLALGVDAKMLVQKKFSNNPAVIGPETNWQKFKNYFVSPGLEEAARILTSKKGAPFHSLAVASSVDFKLLAKLKPDVVNIHWTNRGYMRPEDFKKIKCPIVWTFHDMWPFCGVEHYAAEDGQFKTGYKSGIDGWVWRRKMKILKEVKNLTLVTPSRWLSNLAAESFLFNSYPVQTIPYGIDTEIFKPISGPLPFIRGSRSDGQERVRSDNDEASVEECEQVRAFSSAPDRLGRGKESARQILNLPLDKKIILFGAANGLTNPRKGFDFLKAALDFSSPFIRGRVGGGNDFYLVIFGASPPAQAGQPEKPLALNCPVYYLGKINNEAALATAYNAADVLVAPSVQDNLPNTVLEALACGVPTVAFNIGGMPDMIEHQKNGYLARPFEVEDLARGLSWILNQENYQNQSFRAREKCEQEFTLEIQAKRYVELYRGLF